MNSTNAQKSLSKQQEQNYKAYQKKNFAYYLEIRNLPLFFFWGYGGTTR